MNLLKIQDALKNASDDQLMQLMQSPDSTAPSYLVLSEIRRRKDMRSKQEQAPETTVAEDLADTPETYDQGGIRSLRTPGYEEEERAPEDEAGISAMREGGVVRMQAGGLPPRLEDFYTGRPLYDMSEADLGDYIGYGRMGIRNRRADQALAGMSQEQRDILASESRLELARRQPASRNFGAMGPEPEMTEAEMTLQPALPPRPSEPSPFGEQNRGLAGAIPPDPTNPNYNQPSSTTPPASTQQGGAAGGGGAAAGIRGVGAGGVGAGDGVLAGMQRLEAAFPNNLAALRAELERGRTKPEDRKREATNLALIEAGLRMAASRNPSFLGSIGEGATPAVQSYAQQLGQIRQDERQDIRDRFALEQANLQRMYALGQISAAEYRTRVAEAGRAASIAATEAGANTRLQIAEQNRLSAEGRAERSAQAAADRQAQQSRNEALRNPQLRLQVEERIRASRPRGDRTPVTEQEISNAIVNLGFTGPSSQQGGAAYSFDPNAPGAGLVPNR